MNTMTVAHAELRFNPKVECCQTFISFPDETEILSVEVRENKPILYINYMAPTPNFQINTFKKILFIICQCEYTEVDIQRHRYLGNVVLGQKSFAVFCNKSN